MMPRSGPLAARMRPGDGALLSILGGDFFGALAGAMIHLTMIWWVLSRDVPDNIVGLMVLAIFVPLNLGVLLSGVAVMRFGARTLLVYSKIVAMIGALSCAALLGAGLMTLPILALVAIVTYGAMSPSITADVARVPALTRLAGRKLASFHAINGVVMVVGQVGGMALAGLFADQLAPATIVYIAVALLTISTWITWISFPRDRLRPMEPLSTWQHVKKLSVRVVDRLDNNKSMGRNVVIATIGITAVSEGLGEVILPLGFRAADQSAVALAIAFVLSIFAGVSGAYWGQAKHDNIELAPTILGISAMLTVFVVIGWIIGGPMGIVLAVTGASAAAAASATMTVSTLQNVMPVSLQAQAIGLWQAVLLAAGSLTLLICGQIGQFGIPFLIACALGVLIISFKGRPNP